MRPFSPKNYGTECTTLYTADDIGDAPDDGPSPVSSGTMCPDEDDDPATESNRARLTLVPGTIIDGNYRVLRELGRGAMGLVVRAHDERLDRDVAI